MALQTASGVAVVFDRNDIQSVEVDDDLYTLSLKPGCQVLTRFEQVVKAEASCSCTAHDSMPSPAARVAGGSDIHVGGGAGMQHSQIICYNEVEFICSWIQGKGGVRMICLPILTRKCVYFPN